MKPSSPPSTTSPLLSSLLTLYTLILLYLPSLLFSPLLLSAALLLLSLLRFASPRNPHPTPLQSDPPLPDSAPVKSYPPHDPDPDPDSPRPSSPSPSLLDWDIGAPLEVIHEDAPIDAGEALQRYPSLSRYYPETDSDSHSDSDCSSIEADFPAIHCSPEKACFRWAGEEFDEERDGLIEIQLDGDCGKRKIREQELEFRAEEDSFIEIDISPLAAGKR